MATFKADDLGQPSAGSLVRRSILDTRRGRVIAILGFWTGIAIVIAILSHTRMVGVQQPSSFYKWLADSLLTWYGWAALTPLIIWLSRRYSILGRRSVKNVILLVVAGGAITTIHIAYQCLSSMLVMGDSLDQYGAIVKAQLFWMAPWSFLVYSGIIGVGYAIDFQRRWRERQLAAGQLETELARAKVDALRAQMQPHFLFNTLNSISVLIRKQQLEEAQETLGRLGDLLRYTFALGDRQLVTVAEELEFVKGYTAIEQVRFGSRLTVAFTVDDGCLAMQIPPLTIQPLVENAIRHGLAERPGPGCVETTVTSKDGRLVVTVEDDGVGLSGVPKGESSGVGLTNTRSRLERLFGQDHRFELSPRPGGGTRAVIEVPLGPVGGS